MALCDQCVKAALIFCNSHNMLFCKQHLEDHISTNKSNWHGTNYILEVNSDSKDFLLKFLRNQKDHVKAQRNHFKSHLRGLNRDKVQISTIKGFCKATGHKFWQKNDKIYKENVKLCKSEFKELLNYIESLCNKIGSKTYIIKKEFYSPLESFLLKDKEHAKGALANLTDIEIDFSTDSKILKTSNLSHLFTYHSNYIVYMTDNLRVKDFSDLEIALSPTDARSRYIQISHDEILRTGGFVNKTICEIINITTNAIRQIQSLNVGRYWHTVTWYEDEIMVIGGSNGECSLNSVEIYKNSIWKFLAPLNRPRQSLSSVTVLDSVYVLGGLDRYSIEKYHKNKWIILKVRLPTMMSATGVIGISQNILLIYGGGYRNTFFSKIFKLNLQTGVKKTIGHTEREGRVPYGTCIFQNNQIFTAFYRTENFWQDHTEIKHEICYKQSFGIQH